MVDVVVSSFVDAALAQLRRLDFMRWPGRLPDDMRDDSIPPLGDWFGWKAIPSRVRDAELDKLEQELGLRFPPPYRDFLRYRHFVGLTEVGVRFERHLCDDWDDTLRKAYFKSWPRERILDAGLLPFGSETLMDAGPVCFDTNVRGSSGDYPVVFWDHEWAGTKAEIRPLFSSSIKMFECLSLVAANDLAFVCHDESDDDSLLPVKQLLLGRFLAMDPEGAGGPARDYWTAWGVTPVM